MVRFFAGIGIGIFVGYLLGLVISLKAFMIACLVILAAAASLLFLFHLGIQDFQEY